MPKHTIEKPHYPIVYVRGYAMTPSERQDTFNDTYYGFSATSVEKREAPPPRHFEVDVFEGQLIRLMKMKDYGYADAANRGLEEFSANPTRSLWVCRFYDEDQHSRETRKIWDHAGDLKKLVCKQIPERLKKCNVDLGPNDRDYKVILIAHSMGGLVCRTFIQNLLPSDNDLPPDDRDPKRWVYRLITLGTPHRGIDLGKVPDFIENVATSWLNVFGSEIFNTTQMLKYLKLPAKGYEANSLGDPDDKLAFPVKRCLCIIGSDYQSYGAVKSVTGSFSDGLVKQDRAYVVAGPKPAGKDEDYPAERRCYWANVHRAHSGYRGIVNSYESYENIQRFLFGDTRVEVALEDLKVKSAPQENERLFYDFEFLYSIRNTGVYLHRRQQDPCENAERFELKKLPKKLVLHTGFMNSRLRPDDDASHFSIKLRVVERRVKDGLLWDKEYPDRPIYNETLEVAVGDVDQDGDADVQYRWLADGQKWNDLPVSDDGAYRLPLRGAGSLSGSIVFRASQWPDPTETKDV
jgi:hypothetical protein